MPGLTILHGCRTIQLTQGKNTLIDEADRPLVGEHRWYANKGRGSWYARRTAQFKGFRKGVQLHGVLCPGEKVDHRDGDGLNNTRENLRPCTTTQNARNTRRTYGLSRYKGVCFLKDRDRWKAQIRGANGREINLGIFSAEADAARAYDGAAREHFGEFAATNADIFGEF